MEKFKNMDPIIQGKINVIKKIIKLKEKSKNKPVSYLTCLFFFKYNSYF